MAPDRPPPRGNGSVSVKAFGVDATLQGGLLILVIFAMVGVFIYTVTTMHRHHISTESALMRCLADGGAEAPRNR